MPVASELVARLSVDDQMSKPLDAAGNKISGFAKGASLLGSVAMGVFAGVGAAAVGMGAGIASSIGVAMGFESAMSGVAAVANASDAQLQALSETAIKLGQDTTLSGVGATDAARAMRELAAAGMTVENIIGGGALGALRLASAGGIDVAQAAEIASMALANFGLAGDQATRVADLFASASNASAISTTDLAETLKFVGPIANSMGLSIEEVTATIAALGNQGIKGSQAGTSLRSMMVSLAKPSKEATKLMNNLGLSFFDTNGTMKDLAGISGELQSKLGGLSDKQRAAALATLFGNEALTASQILLNEGADGIAKWVEEVTGGATAAEVGAARNNNLKGSIEALKSSFETAQIVLGKAFLPSLKSLVDMAAAGVSAAIPLIEAWGPRLVAGIQSAIGVLTQFGGYVASAIGAVVGAFKALQSGEITMGQFVGGVKNLIAVVLGDIGGLLGKVGAFLAPYMSAIGSAIGAALPVVGGELVKLGQALGNWVTETAIPWVAGKLPGWKDAIVSWVTGTAIPAITTAVGAVGTAFGGWISGTAIPYLTTNLPLWKDAIVNWVRDTAIPEVTTAVGNIGAAFGGWISGTAIPYLTTNLPLWKDAIVTFITADVIPTVTGWVVGIGNAMGTWISGTAIPYLATNLPLWKNAIVAFITGDVIPTVTGAVVGIGNAMVGWVEGTAIPVVTEKLTSWTAAVTGGIQTASGTIREASDSQLPAALNSGIDKAASESNTHVETWNEGIIAALGRLPALLDSALVPAAHSLGKWIGEAIPVAVGKMQEWTLAIGAVLINLPAILGGLTVALIPPMWHWIRDSAAPAVAAFAGFTGRIVVAVADLGVAVMGALQGIKDSLIKAAVAIGVGIVDGIISGILGGRGRVEGAAKSLGGAATDGATKELQEKSPSKVFRQIGAFAAEGLALGLEDGKSEAAKKAAEVASAVAKAATDVLGAMRSIATFDFAKNTPSTAQFGWLTATATAMVASIAAAAQSFQKEGLEKTNQFADAASKIGGSIKNVLDGLAALAGFDFAKSSPTGSAMAWFTHLATSLVANFAIAAQRFGEGMLKDASELADSAGKVGGSVANTLQGLQALANADWAKSSPSGSAMGWFTHLAAALVQNFATAAAGFAEGALKAASDLADSASKVGGSVKGTLEGLAALATADWAAVSPSGSAMGWFTTLVANLVQSFAAAAAAFETDVLNSANRLAETAGKVAGVIGPALAGFKELATIVAPSQTSIDQLVAGIAYLVKRFGEMAATMESEGVKAMGEFSDATSKALGAAKAGTDLFKSFDKLVIPSAKAIDDLVIGVKYVVIRFGEMAGMLSGEGLKNLAAFSEGVTKVLGAAKGAADLFAGMKNLQVPPPAVIDYLLGSMGYVITQTQAIATGIGTAGIQAAQAFATGVLNVFTTIKTALESFAKLSEFKDIPAKILSELFAALEGALDFSGQMVSRADEIFQNSLEYLDKMTKAAANFSNGGSLGGGVPAVTAPGIPALATGGIVTKPTLALIGEHGPEAVVPLNQYNRGGGGGGTTVYLTVQYQDNTMQGTDRARLADFARSLKPELEKVVVGTW